MFTGIIRYVGTLERVTTSPAGARLSIELGPLAEELALGDSVAVNGACLTVSRLDGGTGEFDVVAETLRGTALGRLRANQRVNLETALPLGGKLDGHLVQGHVDGLAELSSVQRGGEYLMHFTADKALTDQMVPKGSIAINGVSLTLARLDAGRFAVAVIPTTLADTTLGELGMGDTVNIETDVLGKYVRRTLETMTGSGGLSMDTLRRSGFLD